MQPSEALVSAIKKLEGYRSIAYQDAGGVWTCGYGWTQGVTAKTQMTMQGADYLLRGRLRAIAAEISAAVHVPLTQSQFDALVDFEYNLGRTALDHSTLLAKLNAGDYAGAAAEFPKWCHVGDKVVAGLLHRRLVEQGWFVCPASSSSPLAA